MLGLTIVFQSVRSKGYESREYVIVREVGLSLCVGEVEGEFLEEVMQIGHG
jgi:hypothetical protein